MPLKSLFASDEVGGRWDADKSTLFQDTAGTTPVEADGDPVARWEDKSGNGYHLLQGTAANQPTYKEVGGVGWVDFDGVDDFMEVQIPVVNQPLGIAVAMKSDVTNELRYVSSAHDSASNAERVDINQDDQLNRLRINAGSSFFTTTNSFEIDEDHGIIVNANGASSDVYLDGVLVGDGVDVGTEPLGGIRVGADRGGNGFWDGPIYGVVYTDRLFTAQEVSDVDTHHTAIYTEGQSYFDDNPISGTIEDEQGNPVENAIVKIFTESSLEDQTAPTFVEAVLTDANGDWAMQAAYDETKSYKVEYKKFISEVTGTADSATSSSLTDAGAFTAGQFDDGEAIIKLTGGTGSGQERRVTGNADTDTVDIDGSWGTTPDATTTYEVGYMYSDELKFKPPKSSV